MFEQFVVRDHLLELFRRDEAIRLAIDFAAALGPRRDGHGPAGTRDPAEKLLADGGLAGAGRAADDQEFSAFGLRHGRNYGDESGFVHVAPVRLEQMIIPRKRPGITRLLPLWPRYSPDVYL